MTGLPVDPAELEPLPAPWPVELLSVYTMYDLKRTQLALALACGKSHRALHDKHRAYLCFAWRVFDAERRRRGDPDPFRI